MQEDIKRIRIQKRAFAKKSVATFLFLFSVFSQLTWKNIFKTPLQLKILRRLPSGGAESPTPLKYILQVLLAYPQGLDSATIFEKFVWYCFIISS